MLHLRIKPTAILGRKPRVAPTPLRRWTSSTVAKVSDPLRILFCGSDGFSSESLRALHREHERNSELVESLEVMVLPPKPFGRGLTKVREVPCKATAEELGLRIYQQETFRKWNLPRGINLIVVVSFGLFVPPRILNAAKYGGLNVHPSLLPHLRGPAPIHHAILRGESHTGVSLQTLDDKAFDHGTVLAQTPRPGLSIDPETTLSQLTKITAREGAEMLVKGLRDGVHVPPHVDVGWMTGQLNGDQDLIHAPKLAKGDAQINWATWHVSEIERRARVFRALWTRARTAKGETKRILLTQPERALAREVTGSEEMTVFYYGEEQAGRKGEKPHGEEEGELKEVEVVTRVNEGSKVVFFQTVHGGWVKVKKAKVEGDKERHAPIAMRPFLNTR